MKSENSDEAGYGPIDEPDAGSIGSKAWLFSIKFLITCGLIYLIFDKIPFTDVHAEFKNVQWLPLAAGALLTVPNILVQHYKWRYLVHLLDPSVPDSKIFTSLMCGFSIGLVTPGRLGELGKGMFIRSQSKSQLTGMAIIDKTLSLWALSVLGVASLFYLIEFKFIFSFFSKVAFLIFAIVFMTVLLVLVFQPSVLRKIVHLSKKAAERAPFRDKLFSLISASDYFKKHHFMPSFYYSMIFQVIILCQLYLFINAFAEMSFLESLAAGASAMFVKSLLPVAVMDLGIREGAVIYFFGKFGIAAPSALNASIMLFLSNVLVPGMAGLFFFAKYNFFHRHEH